MSEATDHVVTWAKLRKQQRVESARPGADADLPPMLHLRRDGDAVMDIMATQVDKWEGLQGLRAAVPFVEPDEVVWVAETFGSTRFFEAQGRQPDPGEFQRIWEAGNPDGLISEQLTLLTVTSGGDVTMTGLTYRHDRATHELHFDDPVNHDRPGGGLVKKLVEIMTAELTPIDLDPADFGLTDEQARVERDIAGMRVLTRLGYTVGVNLQRDSAVAERWEESIDHDGCITSWRSDTDRVITPRGPKAMGSIMLDGLVEQVRTRDVQERTMAHRREMNRAERRRAERKRR